MMTKTLQFIDRVSKGYPVTFKLTKGGYVYQVTNSYTSADTTEITISVLLTRGRTTPRMHIDLEGVHSGVSFKRCMVYNADVEYDLIELLNARFHEHRAGQDDLSDNAGLKYIHKYCPEWLK